MTFQEIIFKLKTFWASKGCVSLEPYDFPVGAATFHPSTFLRALGPEPWRAVYAQPCRRQQTADTERTQIDCSTTFNFKLS